MTTSLRLNPDLSPRRGLPPCKCRFSRPRRVTPLTPQSQVIGAYTGGGMSLVDAGMVPFQKAYVMICKWRLAVREVGTI